MHHGYRGPKLDMHKFDGKDPYDWVSQMEQLFILHNIQDNNEQLHVALLYLDLKRWRWWQWHKQCVGGRLNWHVLSKVLCAFFDRESNFLGRLTKLRQTRMVKEFITTFEKLAIHTIGLAESFYTECFINGLKGGIQAYVRGHHTPN